MSASDALPERLAREAVVVVQNTCQPPTKWWVQTGNHEVSEHDTLEDAEYDVEELRQAIAAAIRTALDAAAHVAWDHREPAGLAGPTDTGSLWRDSTAARIARAIEALK